MIPLTRLNRSGFLLNPDLIKTMEATPDTVITLNTDEKLVVAERPEAVVELIVAFRRRIYAALLSGGAADVARVLAPPEQP